MLPRLITRKGEFTFVTLKNETLSLPNTPPAMEVVKALNGFPAESLAAHPIPGKWSA